MLIKVKVFPNSKKEEVSQKSEDSFEIKIKEKPKEGRANKAVLKALSSFLKMPQDKIRIVKGFKKRNKIIKIYEL